jgi:hypothetical protein
VNIVEQGKAATKKVAEKINKAASRGLNYLVYSVALNPFLYAAAIAAFVVGARAFETGNTKSLRGSTMFVSGKCTLRLTGRDLSLAQDQVIITSMLNGKIYGVIRATRDSIMCPEAEVSLDPLPMLNMISSSPTKVGELDVAKSSSAKDEAMESVSKKRLLVTGVCDDSDGNKLEPFTDELVEVVDSERLASGELKISAVRRSDKKMISCLEHNIRYHQDNESAKKDTTEPLSKTLVGKTIVLSSICVTDPDVVAARKGEGKSLFVARNALLEVTEDSFDQEGKLKYLYGNLFDRKASVYCDARKYRTSWKIYVPSEMVLKTISDVETVDDNKPKTNGEQK